MADDLLKSILVVTSPSELPNGAHHEESIDALSRQYNLVILLHFGDEKYELTENYKLPFNVRALNYDYETLDSCLEKLEGYLGAYGVDVLSRHKNKGHPLPFLFTGSIVQLPPGVTLRFFEKRNIDPNLEVEKVSVESLAGDWDL